MEAYTVGMDGIAAEETEAMVENMAGHMEARMSDMDGTAMRERVEKVARVERAVSVALGP